jgi:hypothetical protein
VKTKIAVLPINSHFTPGVTKPEDDGPEEKERKGEPMDIFRIAALAHAHRRIRSA